MRPYERCGGRGKGPGRGELSDEGCPRAKSLFGIESRLGFCFCFRFFFLCSWEVSAVALVLCTLAAEAWKRVRHERLREVIYMCVYIYSAICDSL